MLSLLVLFTTGFAVESSVDTLPPHPAEVQELICIHDFMPIFPGCNHLEVYGERKACGDKLLLDYIYNTVEYPAAAQAAKQEGMAVVSFTIEKDGSVTDAQVRRDPGYGMGAAALRAVRRMQREGVCWEPGRDYLNKLPIRVQYNLPIRFKYAATETSDKPAVVPKLTDVAHRITDHPPLFPGCGYVSDTLKRNECATTQLLKFIYGEFKFPPESAHSCATGTIVVEFIVNQSGWIEQPVLRRDIGAGLGKEVLRVINLINERGMRWIPGRVDGEAVDTYVTVPVRIRLE